MLDDKTKKKIQRFCKGINIGKFQSFFINLTYNCPLRCTYCYINRDSEEMDYETADFIIDELTKKSINYGRLITFFGGEPALKVDIIERLLSKYYYRKDSYTGNRKTRYGIITSFSCNQDRLISICDKYPDFEMVISYDNDKYSQRVFPNGKPLEIKKIISKYNLSKYKNNICIFKTCNGHEYNFTEDLLELKSFFDNQGMMYTWSYNRTPFNDINQEKIYNEYYNFLEVLYTDIINNPFNVYIPKIVALEFSKITSTEQNYGGCGLGQEIFFSGNGEIYPCAITNRNIREFEIFDDDNKSEYFDEIQMNLLNNNICQECEIKSFCNGGCVADRLINYNDINTVNPNWCNFFKAIMCAHRDVIRQLNKDDYSLIYMKMKESRIRHFNLCSLSDGNKTVLD